MSAQTTSLSRLLSPPVWTSTPLGKPGIWTSFLSSPWISDTCQDATMRQQTPSLAWMLMLWSTHLIQPGFSTPWQRHNARTTVQQQLRPPHWTSNGSRSPPQMSPFSVTCLLVPPAPMSHPTCDVPFLITSMAFPILVCGPPSASSPHDTYGLESTRTFASGHVPASHVNGLKSRPIPSHPPQLSFPQAIGLNMSMWTWWDLYPLLKATPTCLRVWTASPGGLRPFPSPTLPHKQSPKPSCLGGFPVLEYPPPLHLTAAANLSLACGPNSWLSWVSTVQGQLLTTPVLMDWWKDSIDNLKQH